MVPNLTFIVFMRGETGIPQSRINEVRSQNLYGSESNLNRNYEEGNGRLLSKPLNRIARVGNQNMYGFEFSVDHMYEKGSLRPVAMPLGSNQIVHSPSRSIDDNLQRDYNIDNIRGEVNNQNLYGYQSPRDNVTLIGRWTDNY